MTYLNANFMLWYCLIKISAMQIIGSGQIVTVVTSVVPTFFSCITLFVLFVKMCLGSFTLCRSGFSLKCRRGSKCLGLLGTYGRGGNVSYSLQQISDRRPPKKIIKYPRKLTFLMPKQDRFARTAEFILYYGYDTVYCIK